MTHNQPPTPSARLVPSPGPLQPQALRGRADGTAWIHQPALVVPAYNPAAHMPPTPPMPTATISAKGVLYLHAALVEALSLSSNQPIDLIPPSYGSMYWHLDTRPIAQRRVAWTPSQRPRVVGIQLPPGLVLETLTLHLLPTHPNNNPDYHPLLPANAFTP